MKKLKSLRALQEIKRDKKKEPSPNKHHNLSRKIFRFIVVVVFTLIVGGMGGIILDRFGLPYLLVRFPELNKYEFIKSANERTIIIEKTVETKISSDQAEIRAIKKVIPSLATIVFLNEKNENDKNIDFSDSKTGFIFTNDGLIVVKTDRPPAENEIIKVKFHNGKILEAQWVSFNKSNGIAILKVKDNDLPAVTFGDFNDLELGEKLIAVRDEAIMDVSVSQIISNYSPAAGSEEKSGAVSQKRIVITKNLSQNFYGTPLIDIKGEITGISEGKNLVIPISEIRDFVNKILEK